MSGAPVPRRFYKESHRTRTTEAGGNRGTPNDRTPHGDPAGSSFPSTGTLSGLNPREDSASVPPSPVLPGSPSVTSLPGPSRDRLQTQAGTLADLRRPARRDAQNVQFHHGPCTAETHPSRGTPTPAPISDLAHRSSAFPGGVTRSIWHLNPILPMNARRFVCLIPFGLLARVATVLTLLLWVATTAKAGRLHPENILFGSVWADGRAIASTNLVIEARRGDVGQVVARYRLGEDPGAGAMFFLRIQRESAPVLSPVTVDANEPLTLIVSLDGRTSFRTRVQLPPPGRCLRIDFGRNGGEIVATPVDHLPVPAPNRPAPLPNRNPGKPDDTRTAALASAVLPVVQRRWVMR